MTEDPLPGDSPFGDLIGLEVDETGSGYSRCSVTVTEDLLNPRDVLHGSVAHAMADSGMAASLVADVADGEGMATIEIKVSYLRPVTEGELVCESEVLNRGRSVAFLQSEVRQGERLVAHATGTYAIFEA